MTSRVRTAETAGNFESQRGSFRLVAVLLFLVGAIAVVLVALKGWKTVYDRYFERTPPEITLDAQQPRGIGISPVAMSFTVSDAGTGLDEVVVRIHQRGSSREILRRSLKGDHQAEISIDFPGEKSSLEEGLVRLEIKAFDRSFWSNSSEKTVELNVDFRKPRLEPITLMHNTRRGGAQLVVFRASDAALALCGVKVGSQTFPGFPARDLDPSIDDPTIYAALYAIDVRVGAPPPEPRIFAQDAVGNAVSKPFPNRILPRSERSQVVPVTNDFLLGTVAELTKQNFEQIKRFAAEMGKSGTPLSAPGSPEWFIESFGLVNNFLRILSEQKVTGLLKRAVQVTSHWSGPFEQPNGSINSSFGDNLSYKYENQIIGTARQVGFDILMPKGAPVVAVADGTVLFVESLGTYGRVVAIDHGMGLASIYGRLEAAAVAPGDQVQAGTLIGYAGKTGFARAPQLYFELRVHGVPVDPREWWDRSWFDGHISDQIATAKKLLEIPMGPKGGKSFR